jgi:cell envelope-related function transcriptional attenuator common domain
MNDTPSRSNRKKKKKKGLAVKIAASILVVIILIAATQFNKIYSMLNLFEKHELTTGSETSATISILILGLDNRVGDEATIGHTDSITYIAANTETKKSYALPIYRDAYIPVTCTGNMENINRIYMQNNMDCLIESTSSFLGLPIDNYVTLNMAGFIELVDSLGTISITPDESFCSNYGANRSVEYCFAAGAKTEMIGDETLAYIRYRGGSSGENRANRQVQLIQAIKNQCMGDLVSCYNKATPHMSDSIKTNISIFEITTIMNIFSSEFDMQSIPAIIGTNEEIIPENWRQIVDEEDKNQKTAIIRTEIFEL